MKKKKSRVKKVLLAVLLILVIAAAALALLGRFGQKKVEQENASLETETASFGSITVTAEGSGSVEAASTKAVALEYDGKLETVHVETGDQVTVGDVLAEYDADALDAVIEEKEAKLSELNDAIASTDDAGSTSITAPVSGRIKRIYAAVGDVASRVSDVHGGLAEISADGKMKVEFTSSSSSLSEGDSVTVEFDSYSIKGKVESAEDGEICVTIKDDTEYKVDSEATVWGKSGEKLGTGKLKSNHPYLVKASYGIIDTVEVEKDTYVDAGTTMFTRTDADYNQTYLDLLSDREEVVEDLKDLKEYQKNPVVVSEYDGYIVTLDALEGMPYEKDQQLCTIADEGTLHLKVDIDELDIDGVEVGQKATVVFDAFEEETYEGTVKKISGVGNNMGGVTTYTVTIEMDGDARLKNAMSATATISLETRDNVLLVPVDAIGMTDGTRFVQVLKNGETQRREITVGLVNEEYAEVTSGLSEGEQVVINAKSSTDLFSMMMSQGQSIRESRGR